MNIDPRKVSADLSGDYKGKSIYVAMVGEHRVDVTWGLNCLYVQVPTYASWKVREFLYEPDRITAWQSAYDDFMHDEDNPEWLFIWPSGLYLEWNTIIRILNSSADVIRLGSAVAIRRGRAEFIGDEVKPSAISKVEEISDTTATEIGEIPETPVIDPNTHPEHAMALCIPTLGKATLKWASNLMNMDSAMGITTYLHIVKGYEVGEARQRLVEAVLRMNPTPKYLFFLGDDMLPPANGVQRLYWNLRKHDLRAVSGLYHRKAVPSDCVAWRGANTIIESKDFDPGDTVEVDGCGLDFCLLHTSDIEKLPDPKFKTVHEQNRLCTEDVWFWRQFWTVHRVRPFVDTAVRVGHISWKNRVVF